MLQGEHSPFLYEGKNYLLSIPSAFDFLENVEPLASWLPTSLVGNPFVMSSGLRSWEDVTPQELAQPSAMARPVAPHPLHSRGLRG